MGISFRRQIRLSRNVSLNVSKTGVSASFRIGPFTFNTRGRSSVRLGKGLTYRAGR